MKFVIDMIHQTAWWLFHYGSDYNSFKNVSNFSGKSSGQWYWFLMTRIWVSILIMFGEWHLYWAAVSTHGPVCFPFVTCSFLEKCSTIERKRAPHMAVSCGIFAAPVSISVLWWRLVLIIFRLVGVFLIIGSNGLEQGWLFRSSCQRLEEGHIGCHSCPGRSECGSMVLQQEGSRRELVEGREGGVGVPLRWTRRIGLFHDVILFLGINQRMGRGGRWALLWWADLSNSCLFILRFITSFLTKFDRSSFPAPLQLLLLLRSCGSHHRRLEQTLNAERGDFLPGDVDFSHLWRRHHGSCQPGTGSDVTVVVLVVADNVDLGVDGPGVKVVVVELAVTAADAGAVATTGLLRIVVFPENKKLRLRMWMEEAGPVSSLLVTANEKLVPKILMTPNGEIWWPLLQKFDNS